MSLNHQEKTCLQVCNLEDLVWFLFCGPSTHFRSVRARSVTLTTLFLGKPPMAVYQYLVHILSPVTDNCSSWISGRGRMAVEVFSWLCLHERMCLTWGSNSGRLACPADTLLIELLRPAQFRQDLNPLAQLQKIAAAIFCASLRTQI